jgi:Fic family protein
MLFETPKIGSELRARLKELDELRSRLGSQATGAGPWLGTLRRQVKASSAESSISIEGFHVPADEAVSLVAGEEAPESRDESQLALAGYARAMEHVGVMAVDPGFRWCERVILDLHFDACGFQRDQTPGLWRDGPIGVTAPDGEGLAYVGPDAEQIPELMAEAVDWLEHGELDAHVVVRAAMAHLHVISVHPFRDGNGRVSRIVQSLVLARERLLTPELGSIEEYLGRHTTAYYAVLRETQGGSYQPQRPAGGWVAFCVQAHIEQARRRLAQLAEASARWTHLEALVEQRGWPDRLTVALEQSLFGDADRTSYAREADVSPATASADFRRLLDAGLVVQAGRGRATGYAASETLREGVRDAIGLSADALR